MAACTVYSPCGRYVIRFDSDAPQPLLRLTVTENAKRPVKGGLIAADDKHSCQLLVNSSAATGPLTSSSALHPLRLVASLTESDVLALTTSAGVRKSFASFSQMLYDALTGRSSSVHFFVETVAELKERIERDIQRQGPPLETGHTADARLPCQGHIRELEMNLSALDSSVVLGGVKMPTRAGKGLVRTAVGDTVIELDEDVASEVLEQRFFTLDYDVDFTRAIFPIPLHADAAEVVSAEAAADATCAWKDTQSTSPATLAELASNTLPEGSSPSSAGSVPASEVDLLRDELRVTRDRLFRLGSENEKLRRENEALVRLSRQKMHEMQRLCGDFQHQVQLAAEAEKLRAKNTQLRVQLQEALEGQQRAQHSLDRVRSEYRLLHSANTASREGGRAPLSAGGHCSNDNPYRRSLSRASRDGAGGSSSSRFLHGKQRSEVGSATRASAARRGRSLLSPAPAATVLRGSRAQRAPSSSSTNAHRPTRFDTPPPISDSAASVASGSHRRRSGSRSVGGRSGARDGDGDSPAPQGRTGGRLERGRKPSRRGSGGGVPHGSRASSTHSLPRRGHSLWADSSSYASPCCSVASSRSSSASHERLYRTPTASSRMHQTPKMHAVDNAAAYRRSVFH